MMTASCCYTILGNVFLFNGGSAVTNLFRGLNISRMQTFVRLPTEFDNLLLNAAGYFDVSPHTETPASITSDDHSLHKNICLSNLSV